MRKGESVGVDVECSCGCSVMLVVAWAGKQQLYASAKELAKEPCEFCRWKAIEKKQREQRKMGH